LRWDACACVTNLDFLGSGDSTHLMCFWRNSSSRTPLQSKTEKQLVTSAAIAYGVYPLIQSRFLLLRRVGVGARVGEVISRLSRAGMSLFPHFWTKDSSYKGPWSMIFGPPQLTKRGSDLWKLFSIRLSSRAFTFCSFWICDERRGFGLLYRHLAVFGLFTDLKLSTCLGFPFLSGFSAGVTVRYNLGFVMVSTVRPNLIWRYDGDRFLLANWLPPFLIEFKDIFRHD
jgi:hypothetical protein